MLTAILSALGLGSLGLACAFIPGFAVRALGILRSAIGIVAAYPWQAACAALALFSAWCWNGWGKAIDERDGLARWQAEVAGATRAAAHHPRLAVDQVPQQITNLGASYDAVIAAQDDARARAIEAKREQEKRQEDNRKERNDALPADIAAQRRRTSAWLDGTAHRLPIGNGRTPETGSGSERSDLPDPAFGTEEPDRSDRGSQLIAVPITYLDACDVVTGRLHNAQDWVTNGGMAAKADHDAGPGQ